MASQTSLLPQAATMEHMQLLTGFLITIANKTLPIDYSDLSQAISPARQHQLAGASNSKKNTLELETPVKIVQSDKSKLLIMQTNTPEQNYYQEDEIDLKELFGILWAKKILIISITLVFTLLAGIYAFNKTPIYEGTALVEIGNYKNNNNNVLVDSVPELVKKLNLLFIDLLKNEKDREATITSISTVKGTSSFINIKSESTSNKLASNEINKIITYIQNKHQTELENILNNRKSKITSIDRQINTIKNKQLELLSNKNDLNGNEALLNSLQLISMINGELGVQSISGLIKEKTELGLLLNKRNYKNSEVVGRIITNDYPIKPKKKLIVAIAFIAGFILSIFLVFIMNAFRKEEDKVVA